MVLLQKTKQFAIIVCRGCRAICQFLINRDSRCHEKGSDRTCSQAACPDDSVEHLSIRSVSVPVVGTCVNSVSAVGQKPVVKAPLPVVQVQPPTSAVGAEKSKMIESYVTRTLTKPQSYPKPYSK